MLRYASTQAVWLGQMTVVESSCSMMAGPVIVSPDWSFDRS
jgi:hypothetical protein